MNSKLHSIYISLKNWKIKNFQISPPIFFKFSTKFLLALIKLPSKYNESSNTGLDATPTILRLLGHSVVEMSLCVTRVPPTCFFESVHKQKGSILIFSTPSTTVSIGGTRWCFDNGTRTAPLVAQSKFEFRDAPSSLFASLDHGHWVLYILSSST